MKRILCSLLVATLPFGSVLAHGAAGAVGTMVTQLAREAGAFVIGTGRAADRQKALDFGASARALPNGRMTTSSEQRMRFMEPLSSGWLLYDLRAD